jgi:hypothetical protein
MVRRKVKTPRASRSRPPTFGSIICKRKYRYHYVLFYRIIDFEFITKLTQPRHENSHVGEMTVRSLRLRHKHSSTTEECHPSQQRSVSRIITVIFQLNLLQVTYSGTRCASHRFHSFSEGIKDQHALCIQPRCRWRSEVYLTYPLFESPCLLGKEVIITVVSTGVLSSRNCLLFYTTNVH